MEVRCWRSTDTMSATLLARLDPWESHFRFPTTFPFHADSFPALLPRFQCLADSIALNDNNLIQVVNPSTGVRAVSIYALLMLLVFRGR